jgi:hypothetical protein
MVETTGKLDKKALPKFDKESETDSDKMAAPKTDMEKQIQYYVIKFVSDLQQVSGFLRVLQFPPPIQLTITI